MNSKDLEEVVVAKSRYYPRICLDKAEESSEKPK
jgi:hypothetical protein